MVSFYVHKAKQATRPQRSEGRVRRLAGTALLFRLCLFNAKLPENLNIQTGTFIFITQSKRRDRNAV